MYVGMMLESVRISCGWHACAMAALVRSSITILLLPHLLKIPVPELDRRCEEYLEEELDLKLDFTSEVALPILLEVGGQFGFAVALVCQIAALFDAIATLILLHQNSPIFILHCSGT